MDGLVDVMQDATRGHAQPLDDDRLWRWQSALFPGGTQGVRRIAVGRYRDHADPMQIVSGRPGKSWCITRLRPRPVCLATCSGF